jgi:cobalt-zinc-cadmium efflux system outer membrane protein
MRPAWIFCLAGVAAAQTPAPLTLREVLDSVERNFPPLLAALEEKPLAEADILSRLGRFDLVTRSEAIVNDLGAAYNYRVLDAGIRQATPLLGFSYFSGYRFSTSGVPPYAGGISTGPQGEYYAGGRLPLVRDRAIDAARAEVAKARAGLRLADLSIDQQRIVIVQSATRRYWDWVASGERLRVARAALAIAEQRDGFLRESVRQGALPAIDITDNERVIYQRQGFVVETRRGLEQATIDLSLFYRDAGGEPILVDPSRLPPAFPPPVMIDDKRMEQDIELALDRRPEVRQLLARREQLDIDRKLAINQQYPGIDALFSFVRQLGGPAGLRGPNEFRYGVVFDLPVQRRQARGQEAAAAARINQIEQRARFQRDQIAAEVKDAVSAVRAAFERVGVLRDEVRVTREVEVAERDRYELGETNLFTLNLREIATVDAELREVGSLAEYYRALALYELAIAEALTPRTGP